MFSEILLIAPLVLIIGIAYANQLDSLVEEDGFHDSKTIINKLTNSVCITKDTFAESCILSE